MCGGGANDNDNGNEYDAPDAIGIGQPPEDVFGEYDAPDAIENPLGNVFGDFDAPDHIDMWAPKPTLLDDAKRFMKSERFLPTMLTPTVIGAAIKIVDTIPDKYKSPADPLVDDSDPDADRRRSAFAGPVGSGPTSGGADTSTTSPVRTVLAGRRFTRLGASDIRRKTALGA